MIFIFIHHTAGPHGNSGIGTKSTDAFSYLKLHFLVVLKQVSHSSDSWSENICVYIYIYIKRHSGQDNEADFAAAYSK